nr:hypothetical protein CFP56_25838 [Quercus suber]
MSCPAGNVLGAEPLETRRPPCPSAESLRRREFQRSSLVNEMPNITPTAYTMETLLHESAGTFAEQSGYLINETVHDIMKMGRPDIINLDSGVSPLVLCLGTSSYELEPSELEIHLSTKLPYPLEGGIASSQAPQAFGRPI